jgi:hypothetical protein
MTATVEFSFLDFHGQTIPFSLWTPLGFGHLGPLDVAVAMRN